MGDGEAEAGADAMLMPCPMGDESYPTPRRCLGRILVHYVRCGLGSERQAGALTDAVAKGYALFFPSYLPITASQPLISPRPPSPSPRWCRRALRRRLLLRFPRRCAALPAATSQLKRLDESRRGV
jgi:hypothetical protein